MLSQGSQRAASGLMATGASALLRMGNARGHACGAKWRRVDGGNEALLRLVVTGKAVISAFRLPRGREVHPCRGSRPSTAGFIKMRT